MDFPHGTPGRRDAGGLGGWDGGLLSLTNPGKHPSGMLLPEAGKKRHHRSFPDKFFSGI